MIQRVRLGVAKEGVIPNPTTALIRGFGKSLLCASVSLGVKWGIKTNNFLCKVEGPITASIRPPRLDGGVFIKGLLDREIVAVENSGLLYLRPLDSRGMFPIFQVLDLIVIFCISIKVGSGKNSSVVFGSCPGAHQK